MFYTFFLRCRRVEAGDQIVTPCAILGQAGGVGWSKSRGRSGGEGTFMRTVQIGASSGAVNLLGGGEKLSHKQSVL